MRECLFWYEEYKLADKKKYLAERKEELKKALTKSTEKNIRLLGEHVLLISEKLVENSEYFANIFKEEEKPLEIKRDWMDFYL